MTASAMCLWIVALSSIFLYRMGIRGTMVNPATGRCMVAPILFDASAIDATVPVACTGDYNACGYGCCGGVPMTTRCYYASLGETASAMAADDLELSCDHGDEISLGHGHATVM